MCDGCWCGVACSALLMGLAVGILPAAAEEMIDGEEPIASDNRVLIQHDAWLHNPLIVSALGRESAMFDTPYITDSVTQDEIRGFGYRTVPEALQWTPGVMVQKTGHGQGSPYIRGFTGFRTVFLIDGVRLNNATFRDGPNQYWATVDPFSLERLEVIKGPASVLYGSDAIGGTVNAITKSPYGYGESISHTGGNLYYRGATAERSNTGRIEITHTQSTTLGVLGGFTGNIYGDLRGGDEVGKQDNTGYDQYNADFKAEYFFHDDARLVLAHQHVRQNNAPRTHSTVNGITWEGLTTGSDLKRELDQERRLTYLQFHANNLDDEFITDAKAGLSWQQQDETRDRVRGSGVRELQSVDVGTLGLFAQATSDVGIGELTYGLDFYHDNVDSSSTTNTIQGPVADDATYDSLGLYAQLETDLNDRTHLILGGRWNYAAVDAESVEDPVSGNPISIEDSWNAFVGSARLVYDIQPERLNIFGGVSQGFRAPNLSDLTRLDVARTNEIETPSPGLEPEYYLNFEVGFKGQGENYGWQVAYFYTLIDDMIIRFPTGNLIGADNEVTKANVGDGYVNGIELDGTFKPGSQLTLFGNLTWLMGEVDTFPTATSGIERQYIDRLMPLTINVGARYDIPNTPLWLYTTATWADDADYLSTRDMSDTQRIPPGGTPSYTVVDLGMGWQVKPNLKLTLTVGNIFNEDYRVHGSGVNGAGTNVIFGLDWTF